ncbi:aquaporin family protein [Weissella diestrammenae]|uniref:Aquaporin family protein n=1 Tax=Weissella diestrammenae TaxID=1162633 RepID=A0A7G9T604_9LACO|nr:MIP/aquaporin family protein [Weissella diestrammenae]MCM0582362.1 aquaporin family protein [Weissella diestrammenae]QNN75529.1 aquaporin family protein [Weissella diestrammenae]
MSHTLLIRLLSEFFATALMVALGNGAVANAELKRTKGSGAGWLNIAMGFGIAVAMSTMFFGTISSHANPAAVFALAVIGKMPWSEVMPYISVEMLGAMFGQFVVWLSYKPYFDVNTDPEIIFTPFATTDAAESRFNGLVNEFVGTFILIFGFLSVASTIDNLVVKGIMLGVLVAGLVMSLGGATGPALNPVRDLGPRVMHAILPMHFKGSSHWEYSWVPVIGPTLGGIAAALLYMHFFITI